MSKEKVLFVAKPCAVKEGTGDYCLVAYCEMVDAMLKSQIVKCLGSGFGMVAAELSKNVLFAQYALKGLPEDQRASITIVEALKMEVDKKNTLADPGTCVNLLWLTRGFSLVATILALIGEDIKKPKEDKRALKVIIQDAYANSLKPYHGFIARGAFSAGLLACPYMQTLIDTRCTTLPEGHNTAEGFSDELRAMTQEYLPCIAYVNEAYKTAGLPEVLPAQK